MPKQFDLVFEGGGAKGMAFAGALQVFAKAGFTPRRLVGTSAGAITATLVAAGYGADELVEVCSAPAPGTNNPIFTTFMDAPLPGTFTDDQIAASTTMMLFGAAHVPGFVSKPIMKELLDIDLYRELFSFNECGGFYAGDAALNWIRQRLVDKGLTANVTWAEFAAAKNVDLSVLTTNVTAKEMIAASPTMFTVIAVMKAAGFTLADLKKWGCKVISVPRPSHPDRRDAIQNGTVNAVFDEGIKSWGQTALDNGFVYLPIERQVLKQLSSMGYRTSVVPQSRFRGMPADVATVDFSGWPMVVRADMPNDVAFALCEAIEKRKHLIPTDNFKPIDIGQLCANDEEAPYNIPLHPGARRFYRERGCLK